MTYHGDEAFQALSDEQRARVQAYGSEQEVESGALLFGAGEATYDLILVDSGEVEVVRARRSGSQRGRRRRGRCREPCIAARVSASPARQRGSRPHAPGAAFLAAEAGREFRPVTIGKRAAAIAAAHRAQDTPNPCDSPPVPPALPRIPPEPAI